MRKAVRIMTVAWALAGVVAAAPAQGPVGDPGRGRLLYENACLSCHSTSVSRRESRIAKSHEELRRQVLRWQGATGTAWTREEVEDVTAYLNAFYKFDGAPA